MGEINNTVLRIVIDLKYVFLSLLIFLEDGCNFKFYLDHNFSPSI